MILLHLVLAFVLQAADGAPTATPAPAVPAPKKGLHRYMVVRTFPPKALDGLTPADKANVNKTNAKYGVRWVHSFATEDKTKTFCVYEGPNAKSIQDAADANKIPVDSITEIPAVIKAH